MTCTKKPITDSLRDSEESPNTHCQVMVTTKILYFPFKYSLTKLSQVWNSRIKQLKQPRRVIKAGVFRVQTILNPFSHSNKDVCVCVCARIHTHSPHLQLMLQTGQQAHVFFFWFGCDRPWRINKENYYKYTATWLKD